MSVTKNMSVIKEELKKGQTVLCLILKSIFLAISPLFLRYLGESINVIDADRSLSVRYIVLYAAFILLNYIANYGMSLYFLRIRKESVERSRLAIFDLFPKADWRYLGSKKHGELLYKCSSQLSELCNDTWEMLFKAIEIIITVSAVFLQTIMIEPLFIIVYIVIIPISVYLSLRAADVCIKTSEERQKRHEQYIGVLSEIVSNINEIQVYGAKDLFENKYSSAINAATEGENLHQKSILNYRIKEKFYNLICYFTILFLAIYLVSMRSIPIGYLITLTGYGAIVFMQFSQINYIKDMYINNSYLMNSLDDIRRIPQIDDRNVCISLNNQDNIVLDHVTAAYSEDKPLNYSFTIHYGEFVALKGKSGAGKSTLLKLLVKLLPKSGGKIWVAGQEIDSIAIESLRQYVCYTSQSAYIFDGTVAENIFWVNPSKYSSRELKDLLTEAGLWNLVYDVSGVERHISDMGRNISGGEQQRIAILRALLRNSSIYLFDESFSNLDSETELKMIELIKDKLQNKTVIFVSHTDQICNFVDRVIELE